MSRIFTIVLAGATLLASCIRETPIGNPDVEVNFTGNLAQIKTRVGGADGTTWTADDPVGIYMVKAEPGTISDGNVLTANKYYKATAGTTATFAPVGGAPMIYPTNGDAVKFVAYHPYKGTVSADNKVSVSVADQSNLSAIDVLYAPVTEAHSRTSTSAVPLAFEHKLTKLVFNISNGDGVTEPVANGISVAISGQQSSGTLDLVTGAIAAATGTPGTITATAAAGAATIEAIVLPSASLSEMTFTFTNNANQSFTVSVPTSAWQGGYFYTYTVTLKAADKTSEIQGTIGAWNDGGNEAIEGKQNISTGAEAGKKSFSFVTEDPWTATVEGSGGTRAGGSNVDWLKLTRGGVETYSGEAGTVTLDAELTTNFTGKDRSAQIIIAHGSDITVFGITQSATGADGEVPTPGSQLTFYVSGTGSITVDWGDGSISSHNLSTSTNNSCNHPYAEGKEYIVTVKGNNITSIYGYTPYFDVRLSTGESQSQLIYLKSTGGSLITRDPDRDPALVEALYDRNIAEELDLSGDTDVTIINFGNNKPIGSLNVNGCTALKSITSRGSGMASLNVNGCTALEYINLYSNPLTEIDVTDCTALSELVLAHFSQNDPPLNSIDLSGNPALKTLYLNNTGLTEIDLSHNPLLESLDCPRNKLTELDVSDNPRLDRIVCEGNQLQGLNVRNNPALELLVFAFNSISSIDLSGNPMLKTLSCNRNGMDNLDLSNNPELENLECPENQFSSLDLGHNPLLRRIWVNSNSLTGLYLNNNERLQFVNCSDNELFEIHLANMPTLWEFNCSNNNIDDFGAIFDKLHRNGGYDENMGVYVCENVFDEEQLFITYDSNKTINISGNPGAMVVDVPLAEEQTGWTIVK